MVISWKGTVFPISQSTHKRKFSIFIILFFSSLFFFLFVKVYFKAPKILLGMIKLKSYHFSAGNLAYF